MSKESLSIFTNFIRTQQPEFVYEIPDEDQDGNEIDLIDEQQMAAFDPERDFKKMPFGELGLGHLLDADEQFEAGGLLVTTDDGRYLIPYA